WPTASPRSTRATPMPACRWSNPGGSAFVIGPVFGRVLQGIGGAVEQTGEVPATGSGDRIVYLDGHIAVMRRAPPQIPYGDQPLGRFGAAAGLPRCGSARRTRREPDRVAPEMQPDETGDRPEPEQNQ